MSIEIVNTGSELMLGRVLNTHQQWLCSQLDVLGYSVSRQVAISDEGPAIVNAVRQALSNTPVVIVTGGLGPTSDDLTRTLIAQLLHRQILTDPVTLERIRTLFKQRNRPVPFHCEVQAQYPEGAHIIPNDYGTAPGLLIELPNNPFHPAGGKALIIMLPGPPRELRPMFLERVIPLLKTHYPLAEEYACTSLRTACTGESILEQQISPLLEPLVAQGLEVGYCARIGEVDLRFSARGEHAKDHVAAAEKIARDTLGNIIFGLGEVHLENIVVDLLRKQHKRLGCAESCTGGFLAHRITNVPGASEVFIAGCVTYSNESKINLLGVTPESLDRYGAVSEQVACEMAAGLRTKMNLDYALSVTGIAGPGGGTPEKPVGTAWIGLATPNGCRAEKQFYPYDRESFKLGISQCALDWLRKDLTHHE